MPAAEPKGRQRPVGLQLLGIAGVARGVGHGPFLQADGLIQPALPHPQRRQVEVGAGEAMHVGDRLTHAQARHHVLPDLWGGGGRAGDQLHRFQGRRDLADAKVVAAEVVSPLRDAVGLVDHQPRRSRFCQHRLKVGAHQTFGGDIEQAQAALAVGELGATLLATVEVGVEGGGGDAAGAQRLDLVLHQGDQRRDHHRGAGREQRGQLIAQRFATAGGHHHHGVAAGHHRLDHLTLAGAEVMVAEVTAQRREERVAARRRHRRDYCSRRHFAPTSTVIAQPARRLRRHR